MGFGFDSDHELQLEGGYVVAIHSARLVIRA
jgi:hypothetical protein